MASNVLKPQRGPQERFLASSADIVIYGGAAGGGKTYALLLDILRYVGVNGFTAAVFRKEYSQVTSPGGLWDSAFSIYGKYRGAVPRKTPKLHWEFPSGATVNFAHISRDIEVESWQGSQICELCFDELTHFSEYIFFYMMSRNRSTCGVKPCIRGTCNPDPDSWVSQFISWWIDQETGYPIKERSGVVRWMIRRDNVLSWADTKDELVQQFKLKTPGELSEPKSVTFIASSVEDNQELLRVNRTYLANLKALPEVERERLLYGNWKIRPAAGSYFKRTQLGQVLPNVPQDVIQWVRCWDLAATDKDENGNAAYTAGVLMGKRKNGRYLVADVINMRLSAGDVRKLILLTAQADRGRYRRVRIRIPQDPGQAGKEQAQSYIKFLAGFDVCAVRESGSKESRAEPMAAQWQAGNFDIVSGPWNDEYILQLENFPEGKYKDMVDASANGFTEIELRTQFNISNLT